MDIQKIQQLAAHVDDAAKNASEIEMLSATEPFEFEDAYKIQRASMALRYKRGEAHVGMKMGLTSIAKMEQMGVHNPIYGHLTDEMKRASGDKIVMSDHCHPRVEPEIAFIMKKDLKGPTTAAECVSSVEYVLGALEVIDSRYKDFKFTLPDVVADNASSTRFFLGDKVVPLADIDVSNLGMVLSLNGKIEATGSSAAIFEHPLKSLAKLANMLAEVDEYIHAGEIVLAGGATKAIHLKSGDFAEVEIEGLGKINLFVGD